MTEEVKQSDTTATDEAAAAHAERIANTPPPTKEERAAILIAEFEHAHAHNAPVSLGMLAELRDLLGVAKPEPDATGD